MSGLVDEILVPAYATSVGLIHYGAKMLPSGETNALFNLERMGKFTGKLPGKGAAGKLIELLKSFLP